MRYLLCFFVLLSSHCLIAQKGIIDTKIIYKDGTEKNARVKFLTNWMWRDLIEESSIAFKSIPIVDENNKVKNISSSLVQKLEFVDLKGKSRTFVSHPQYKYLVEEIYDGKRIKWFRVYSISSYDHTTHQHNHLLKKYNKTVVLGVFSNNKKKLKELTKDRSDLIPLIDNINFDRLVEEDLIEVLKKYDEY